MVGYSVYWIIEPRPQIRPCPVFVRYHVNRYVKNSPSCEKSHHPAVVKFLAQDESEEENAEAPINA